MKLLFAFIISVMGVAYASQPDDNPILTADDEASIKQLLINESGYEVIKVNRSPLGLVEVHIRKVTDGETPKSGPVYFFHKKEGKWYMHKEMSEWYVK